MRFPALFLYFLACGQSAAPPPARLPPPEVKRTERELEAAISAEVQPLIDDGWLVSASVSILDNGRRYFFGFGQLAKTDPRRPEPDTLYEIGSLTKVFTSLLLADMVVRGEVALETTVDELLPARARPLAKDGEPVRLVHLATHRSGLPRMPDNFNPADLDDPYADYDENRLLDFLTGHELAHVPGRHVEYSNVAVGLLGYLLARRIGEDYRVLLTTRVLYPLGLRDTHFDLDAARARRAATGHDADGKSVRPWRFGALAPAGGLSASGEQLLNLAAAIIGGSKKLGLAIALATKPRAEFADGQSIGLGWICEQQPTRLWHNGRTGGFSSFLALEPDDKRAVGLLVNTSTEVTDALGQRILDVVARRPRTPWDLPKSVALPPAALDELSGRYEFEDPNIRDYLTVTRTEEGLYIQLTGQPVHRMFASGPLDFYMRAAPAVLHFKRGFAGFVDRVVLEQGGQKALLKRYRR